MKTIQHLTKTLEEHHIEYKVENIVENDEIHISIVFQSSFKTLWVIFNPKKENDDMIVKFIDQPEEVEGIKINLSEWNNFVEQMILPGYEEENIAQLAFDSWTQEKTSNLLTLDTKKEVSEMYFIALDKDENWSYLHEDLVMNPFTGNVCINEAGKEGGHWGAAQYKTVYSNSFINFEGIMHNTEKNEMLFFLSCSYLPTPFGIANLQAKTDFKFNLKYHKNMPIDLVLAIEALPFPLMDTNKIMREITESSPNALFFTYVMLSYFGSTQLLKFLPEIVKADNQDVINYLTNEYKRVTNKEVTEKFYSIIQAVE